MQDFRCAACGWLLFKGTLIFIEARCPRCKVFTTFRAMGEKIIIEVEKREIKKAEIAQA